MNGAQEEDHGEHGNECHQVDSTQRIARQDRRTGGAHSSARKQLRNILSSTLDGPKRVPERTDTKNMIRQFLNNH